MRCDVNTESESYLGGRVSGCGHVVQMFSDGGGVFVS